MQVLHHSGFLGDELCYRHALKQTLVWSSMRIVFLAVLPCIHIDDPSLVILG